MVVVGCCLAHARIVMTTRSAAGPATFPRPRPPGAPADRPATARLGVADLARLAAVGLRTRKLRAALSGLGIAIGVAAIVAVLGRVPWIFAAGSCRSVWCLIS
jgi:hypothetical protein